MPRGHPNVRAAAGDDPQRNETRLRLAVSDAVLEPTNPFEPKKETSPKAAVAVAISLFLVLALIFVYFRFQKGR
jgi:hypothetical protein